MREVMRAVLRRVSSNATIIEFLDPFGGVREPVAAEDGKCGEATIFNVAIRGLGEGVDIPDGTGFQEFNSFTEVIQLLLVTFFLGGQLLLEAVSVCLQGNNKPVDDGPVGVSVEGMSGDGATDQSRGHPPKGEEMVGNSGVSSDGYWSMGSRSKESRYSGVWAKDGWLWWGELFKRHIDESRGSGSLICRRSEGFCRVIVGVI